MKLFQVFESNMVMLGLNSYQFTNQHPFNDNIFVSFFICASSMILSGAFIFCEADNFMEYTEPIYILSSEIMVSIAAAYACIKVEMTFQYMERLENLVNSSK